MKFRIVFVFLFATALLSRPNPESSDEPGTPVGRCTFSGRIGQLEITPGSDLRRQPVGRETLSFFNSRTLGNPRHVIYLITTGAADLAELPVWDLDNRELTLNEIDTLLAGITRALRNQRFYRYVGITTRGVYQRRGEHARATVTHPDRRLPFAILNENAQGDPGRMHILLRGVHLSQLERLEALLIRELDGTGQLGLNANTGHLGTPERGIRGQVEVTPSTATPGLDEGRAVFELNQTRITPVAEQNIPVVWQDIIYLITPPEIQITAPIFNLNNEEITEEQMEVLELRLARHLDEIADAERYVGLAGAGTDGVRTPQTRAREHERAALDTPYRRLPLAITRINQEDGPVQMHVLLAGVHPNQIAWVEGRLIRLLGGTTVKGWNSNPGKTVTTVASTRKSGRRDPDPDLDGFGRGRPSFSFGSALF